MIRSNASPRNQWKVSSITSGERFNHRSSMSIFENAVRWGHRCGSQRLWWSPITSSVAYSLMPYWAAILRETVDLPAPLPPPSQ